MDASVHNRSRKLTEKKRAQYLHCVHFLIVSLQKKAGSKKQENLLVAVVTHMFSI